VRLYSWAQVLFLASLVGLLHGFPLLGFPWSSCLVEGTRATDWLCVAFFHLYEVPLAAFFAWHAWLGFRRFSPATLSQYTAVTLFQVTLLVVFVTFESRTMLEALAHHRPAWEIAAVFGGCAGMIVDCVLGGYTVFARLVPAALDRGAARDE
jgi:hypothetical protein